MTKTAGYKTEEDDPRNFSISNDNDDSRRWQKNFAARKKERNEQANKESVPPPPHHHQQQAADTERLWSISNFRHHSKNLDNCNKLIDDYSRLERNKNNQKKGAEDITGTRIHTPFCCLQEEASNTKQQQTLYTSSSTKKVSDRSKQLKHPQKW